jgi:hypothetical protein
MTSSTLVYRVQGARQFINVKTFFFISALRRLNFMLSLSLSLNLCCLLQLSEIVNQGKLVSDEIIISLLSKRLESGEAKGDSGFILDGFPRTINQAVSIFAVFKRDCYYVNSVSFSFYFFNL